MLRILLLSDSFLPHAGGSREYYNNIYQELCRLGDSEVTVLTKKVPGWKEFDQRTTSKLFHIHRRFKPLRSWKIKELPKGIWPFFQTLWRVVRNSPDIVHAGDLYPQGLIAMTLKKMLGIPYLIYCHGEEITQTDRFRFQPFVRNHIYLSADAVVANSEFARQNLLRIGVMDERIHKITPGVETLRFTPGPPRKDLIQRYGLEGKIVVLTVARLVPRKGHRAAINAFAQICREIPNAHYLIVGTGPEESGLRECVQRASIADRVTFAGYVSGEQLPDIYNISDIMLMPNRQEENGDVEGFGIVFLEANAAGKPVIGGRSGGAVEAILDGVTGYLVNPDDPDEIAGILRRLLSDCELRARLGTSGADRVHAEYTWPARAEALRKINLDILKSKSSRIEPSRTLASKPGQRSEESAAVDCNNLNSQAEEDKRSFAQRVGFVVLGKKK